MPGPASRRVGTDHALKHKRMEGNQTWYPAGTETVNWGGKYIYNHGSACSWSTNHVSFFSIGMDSKCYEKRWARGISGWNDFELPGTWSIPLRALTQNKNEQKITVYGLNEESKLFYCGRTGLTDNTGWSHTIFDGDIYSKEIAARKLMYSPLGLIAPFAKTLRQRQQAGKR